MSFSELWACARYDLKLSDAEFLAIAPAALDALLERHRIAKEETRWHLAAIRAELWNPHLKPEDRLNASDFMPGAAERKQKEHDEFVEKVKCGEKFEVDAEAVKRFRQQMADAFSDVHVPEITNIGPSGKPEPIGA